MCSIRGSQLDQSCLLRSKELSVPYQDLVTSLLVGCLFLGAAGKAVWRMGVRWGVQMEFYKLETATL